MNSRTPTAAEARYGHLCQFVIGCAACRLDGRPMNDPNETWIAFHHNDKVGSVAKGCHFYAMGLCIDHHQGDPKRTGFPVRHGAESQFRARYGNDFELCEINWRFINALPDYLKRNIMDFCPFEGVAA